MFIMFFDGSGNPWVNTGSILCVGGKGMEVFEHTLKANHLVEAEPGAKCEPLSA